MFSYAFMTDYVTVCLKFQNVLTFGFIKTELITILKKDTTIPPTYISAIMCYIFKDVTVILNEWGLFKTYLNINVHVAKLCHFSASPHRKNTLNIVLDSQEDKLSGTVLSVSMALLAKPLAR
jgi:hypothetical protein